MNEHLTSPTDLQIQEQAEHLARSYLENLAAAEGVRVKSLTHVSSSESLPALLEDIDDDSSLYDRPSLRADLAATTVLLARAIVREKGLAKRLRKEAPVVAIGTHTSDAVDLVERSLTQAIMGRENQRRHIVVRDGTKSGDKPTNGNAEVVDRINRGYATVGIAPDARFLPSALLRLAEFRLSLPAMDEAALRLVIEAVTGSVHEGEIDEELIRQADFSDLLMSIRGGFAPSECLAKLKQVIDSKSHGFGDGPSLAELDGYGAAKTWGLELAADFVDYKSGRLSWEQFDHKALLLSGPPGVGKTSFARALAKTCAVPLIDSSVAQWNTGGHLGDTLRNIADVFGRANRSAPCILFIDEFDGISSRASMSGDHYTYWAQIVNRVLELMGAIDDRKGVVVVAAANHPERIDPAMKRAGRLDLEIAIERPDVDTLGKIFRHYLGSGLDDANVRHLALSCQGATGADVQAYVNRARATARREGRDLQIDHLFSQIRDGRDPMSVAARHRAAVHEAGHALVGLLLKGKLLQAVSLHERGGSTAFTVEFDGTTTKADIENEICIALSGRVAEELLLGASSIGSASDLRIATNYALRLETHWGFGHFANVVIEDVDIAELRRHPYLLAPIQLRLSAGEEKARSLLEPLVASLRAIAGALEKEMYLSSTKVEELYTASLSDQRSSNADRLIGT